VNTHCSVAATMEAILRVLSKIVSASAGCPCGANPPDAACLTDGPANFAPG
jgi:hypothetical protein